MSHPIGNVAIILNAHFPYVRRAGRWPHGEESLHQVIAESYVPLIAMMYDLRSAGVGVPLSVSISPILLEQLADPVIAKHFGSWMGAWRERAAADLIRFEADGQPHAAYLARFYLDWIDTTEQQFTDRFDRNLVLAIRGLLRSTTEVLLAPATAAYVPRLTPAARRAQIETGALVVLRHLGRRPSGLWLPGGGMPPDLAPIAAELGLRYAIGAAAMHAHVEPHDHGLPMVRPSQSLAEHVNAPGAGYPGDGLYREFYRAEPMSGIGYWRVTGADVPLNAKQWYDPFVAFNHVEEHAAHFVRAVRAALQAQVGSDPTVVVAFDCELFGHWWFEGVRWLQHVLSQLHAADDLRLVTAGQALASLPHQQRSDPPLPHPLFDAPIVEPLWLELAAADERLSQAVRQRAAASELHVALLSQATRELMLAQSSDWPALIATDAAAGYAQRRFAEHLARLDRLLEYARSDAPPAEATTYLGEIAELDNPFPVINYRVFGPGDR